MADLRAILSLHAGYITRVETEAGTTYITAEANQGLELALHGTPWRVDWRVGREVGVRLRD